MASGTFLPPGIRQPGSKISSGGTDNYVMTAVDSENIQGEANLTFDGSTLTLDGDLTFTGAQTIATSAGNLTIGAATGADVLIGDNSTILYVDGGTNSLGVNVAANANYTTYISRTFTATGLASQLRLSGAITGAVDGDMYVMSIGANTLVEAGSGTHALAAGLALYQPAITNNGAATTNAATLYVAAAMAGATNDYALFVDAGVSRFDGTVLMGATADTGYAAGANNLVVGDGSNAQGITILSGNNSFGNIYWTDGADIDGARGYIQYGHGTQGEKMTFGAGGSTELQLLSGGILCINDSANANMTTGLTINQGAADDSILEFKSSDVSHPTTGRAEADTYAKFMKASASDGGLNIETYTTGGVASFQVLATASGTHNTTHTASGDGIFRIFAYGDSGDNIGAVDADGNLMVVANNGAAKFIVDEDGDIFYDGAAAAYDDHDDVALLRALQNSIAPEQTVRREFDSFLSANEEDLIKLGILGGSRHSENPEDHGLVCLTKLTQLLTGGIVQLYGQLVDKDKRLDALESKLVMLEGAR